MSYMPFLTAEIFPLAIKWKKKPYINVTADISPDNNFSFIFPALLYIRSGSKDASVNNPSN